MSLNVAARALTTNQSVLQVIGHNISNANTVGYSRQSVSLDSVAGQKLGNGYFGKGVEITSVKRSYDAFLTKQANSTATLAAGDELRYQKMQQVEALFPLGEGSLGTQLNNALNAWVDVQASPADSTARQVVIDRADEFAARIRDTAARLSEIGETAKLQSAEVVKAINQMAAQFADLNKRVVSGLASGQPPNDLLDQRDELLAELNKKINVSAISADDGSVTLFVANSYPLVMGSKAGSLAVVADPLDTQNRQVLSFVNGSTSSTINADMVTGGEIKGLHSFINNDLTGAMSQLGRLAFVFANEVNTQQKSGLDLAGAAGTNMFSFAAPVVSPAVNNGGTAALSLSLADDKLLAGSDYEVTYSTATTVTIRRLADGAIVAGSPVPVTLPTTVDGLTLANVSGAAIPGDRFLLRPTANAAKDLAVALSSPAELAAASRLSISPTSTNTGSGVIESTFVTLTQGVMPAAGSLLASFPSSLTLTFEASTNTFAVLPVPTAPASVSPPPTLPLPLATRISYTPGNAMEFEFDDGVGPPSNKFVFSVALRGTPANNDTFTLSESSPVAVKFNAGNAQAVLSLRDKTVFDSNTTLSDGYVTVFSSVASTLRESKFSAEFSAAQAASAETQRANKTGVNLDEEAALLIQYQQAYQASAKYMGTVQSMFDTLMSAFR